jgi:hypothetical protein
MTVTDDSTDLVTEIRALRAEIRALRSELRVDGDSISAFRSWSREVLAERPTAAADPDAEAQAREDRRDSRPFAAFEAKVRERNAEAAALSDERERQRQEEALQRGLDKIIEQVLRNERKSE